jgi:hypothetical protein
MPKRKSVKIVQRDPRDIPVSNEILEHYAKCPSGGSGEGSFISGRIQSMARELMIYRKQGESECGLLFGSVVSSA